VTWENFRFGNKSDNIMRQQPGHDLRFCKSGQIGTSRINQA